MKKIFLDQSYIVIDLGDGTAPNLFSSNLSEFSEEEDSFYISKIYRGDSVTIPFISIGTYFDETGLIPYTKETLSVFLRGNTGKPSPQERGQIEVWRLYGHSGAGVSYTGGDLNFKLFNDGAYENNFKLGKGFNTLTSQLDLSEFELNSNIELTLDYTVTTTANNQTVQLSYHGSIGDVNSWTAPLGNEFTYKSLGTHTVSIHVKFPIEFQSDIDNPAEIRFFSTDNAILTPRFLHIVTRKTL